MQSNAKDLTSKDFNGAEKLTKNDPDEISKSFHICYRQGSLDVFQRLPSNKAIFVRKCLAPPPNSNKKRENIPTSSKYKKKS